MYIISFFSHCQNAFIAIVNGLCLFLWFFSPKQFTYSYRTVAVVLRHFQVVIWVWLTFIYRGHFIFGKWLHLKQINYSFINNLWSYRIMLFTYLLKTLFLNHLHIIWMQSFFLKIEMPTNENKMNQKPKKINRNRNNGERTRVTCGWDC